ncbi:hypothetical protein [Clostridium butyricum]|uniref:hypothetical protein n=1 Tax=Clostridium butyricum TaxID=1492 RepID=UPI00374F11FC
MNQEKAIDWEALVLKVASHKGTIKDFCIENNLKKFQRKNKVKFHEISLKSQSNICSEESCTSNIKIELGNSTIYIPANEIAALNSVIKELKANV